MHQHDDLSKLTLAMSVLAFFCVMTAIGAGMNIKAYFDSLDSRRYWLSKIEQEKASDKEEATATIYDAQNNPSRRLYEGERRLASTRQRIVTNSAMTLFFGGLLCWGWHGWKRISQTAR